MNLFQKIGLLWKANKIANEVKKMDMSKWFEREWILHVLGIIGTVWGMLDGFIPKQTAIQILGVLLIVFTTSRTLIKVAALIAKWTKSTKDDELIAKIEGVLDVIGEKLPKDSSATASVTVVTPPAVS